MTAVNEYFNGTRQLHEELKKMMKYLDKLREEAKKELDKLGRSL